MFVPEKSYNDLPKLPPILEFDSPVIFKKLIISHRALPELKGYSKILPDN
jgi:hypothetical protein